MRWLGFVVPFIASTALAGDLINSQAGAFLTPPDGWVVRSERGSPALLPPANSTEDAWRWRVHIRMAQGQPATLEAAMKAETDRVTARGPAWGSSNDRKHFLGASPVRTRSGLPGLAAKFGSGADASRRYTINKYYFRSAGGKVFVVCVHVLGDQTLADEYEKMVLERLRVR